MQSYRFCMFRFPKLPFNVKLSIDRDLLILWTFCVGSFVRAAERKGDTPLPSDGTSNTPRSYSSYTLTLVDQARNAGATSFGTCKNVLLAVILRNPKTHASSLICSKSSDLLRSFSHVSSICFTEDALLDEWSENASPYERDVGNWKEDGRAWKSGLRKINRTLVSCCAHEKAGGESLSAECFLNASLMESFNQFSTILGLESSCRTTSLSRTLNTSVQPPENVSQPNNTDVFDSLNQSLQELNWMMTNLIGKENKELNEIRESVTSLYTLESSLSLTTGVNFNWINTTETSFLICNVITAFLAGDDPLPVCSSVCQRNQRLLQSLSHFLNISQIPILKVLSEASIPCHNTNHKSSRQCVMPKENSINPVTKNGSFSANNTNIDQKSLAGGFCFTVGCKFPLQETRHRSRWLKTSQADLRRMHNNVQQAFPSASVMFNASLWPCGMVCGSTLLSKPELRIAHIFVSLCGLTYLCLTTLVVIVFYCNRRQLGQLFIFRLLVCDSIAGGLENITHLMSLFDYKSIICYSDDILVLDQPGTMPGCGFLAWFAHFAGVLTTGYFFVLVYAWQEVMKNIDQPGFGQRSPVSSLWLKYRQDALSLVLVSIPAVALTAGALARKAYEGSPEVGTCLLSRDGLIYFFEIYEILVMVSASYFLCKGIRYSRLHKKTVQEQAKWMQKGKGMFSSKMMAENMSFSQAALRQLSRRLQVFLAVVFVSAVGHTLFTIFTLSLEEEAERKMLSHRVCTLTSCTPNDCLSGEYSNSLGMILLFSLIGILRIVLLSLWALRPQLLKEIPCVSAVVRFHKKENTSHSTAFLMSTTTFGNSANVIRETTGCHQQHL